MEKHKKNISYKAFSGVFLLLLMFSISQIGLVSSADWDNDLDYTDDNMTVIITNWFGLGEELGRATLRSHTTVDDIRQVFAGEKRIVMYYDFYNWDEYQNGLGEVTLTDLNTGQEIERDYHYKIATYTEKEYPIYERVCEDPILLGNGSYYENCFEEQTGTETRRHISSWTKIQKKNIPAGNVTIGLAVDVWDGDVVDGVWEIAGKKVSRHAGWEASLSNGLVFYYSFNDFEDGATVRDVSANAVNMNGTISTPANLNYTVDGKIGYGMNFSSADVITSASNIGISGDSSRSTFLWVELGGSGVQNPIISWGTDASNNAQSTYAIHGGDGSTLYFDSRNTIYVTQASGLTNITSWHFIGMTYDNATSNISWYVNGAYAGTDAIGSDLATGNTPFLLGDTVESGSGWVFVGAMDEISTHNRVLTQSEIATLWNSGEGVTFATPNTAPTVTSNTPANNTNFSVGSVTMNCSATDDYGIQNISLYIDGTLNQTVTNSTPASLYLDIETTEEFSDGSYLWYCESEDYQVLSGTGEERNFTIDTTYPTITGTWNLTNLTVYSMPTNSTWNYTASDIHLADCWYNTTDNATITFVTCNSTITDLQWDTQGDKTVYYYVNDTGGLETYGSKLINIAYISSDYYHTPDVTGEGGQILFELYVNKTNIETTTAYLFLNNTIFDPDNTDAYTNYYYFNYTFNVPNLWGNTTGKEYDYNWNYTINGVVDNRSTATDNFTIWEITFDDCTTYGELILNFSLKDEEGNTYINSTAGSNVEIDLTLTSPDGSTTWDFNNIWSDNATGSDELDALVCMPYEILNTTNYSIDYTVGFDSTDHVWEFFYLENGTLDQNNELLNVLTNRTLSLMDLLSADSTSFLFNYFDEDGLIVEDIIVHTFRQYIGEGAFREVERSRQNDDGDTIVHLVEEDVIYYFAISQNGTILYTSSSYTALCQTTPCEIQLEESGGFQEFTNEWDLIENGGYLITSSSLTRDVTLNYTLTSPSTMNMTLYKLINDGSYSVIGSNQSTGLQDNLVLNVPTISGNTSFFVSVEQDGTFIKSQWIDLEDDAGLYFGNVLSLFLGALIILALGLMAVSEGSPTILFLMLGMFLAMVLGLVDYRTSAGVSILIYFIVAGGIIIWKLTRRNR